VSDQRVGGYEIVRPLARGGMAVVYLVRQPALDRHVVLKRLHLQSDDPRLAQRFVQEARLAARLDHPNVVTLFDFFEHGGVPYIAMEYVSGGSLRPLVGALTLPQVFGVAEGMLAALRHAESRGITHRDLKPENVLLTGQGGVKIADFGIARAYNELTGRLTSTGMALGTPAYMAPEQAQDHPLGPFTDLYAVGVVVYELLAGRPPFHAETPVAVLWKHVHQPPPPLTRAPAAVRDWVVWLLEKAPGDRPQGAAQAWEALEEIAVAERGPYWRRDSAILPAPATTEMPSDATTAVAPPARRPLSEPPRGRSRRLAAGAAALLAVAGATFAALKWDSGQETGPPGARDVMPYDFDRNGRQELVVTFDEGSPADVEPRSGAVIVQTTAGWRLITQDDAGVPGRPAREDAFGSGVTSGDFDRDGWADLALGVPGKDHVSVLYGSEDGLVNGRRQQLGAPELPAGAGRYGRTLIARDVDGDAHDDLLVGAPGGTPGDPGVGAVHVLFGGDQRLVDRRPRRILRPPDPDMRAFGSRMRFGDVDGDGHADLVEGTATTARAPGHATYCAGTPEGPMECRRLGTGGSSSLALADVNRDRRADIVQGDAGLAEAAGEVRLWLGRPEGPREARTITQETGQVPGDSEPGDGFGSAVEAGDLDDDGYADIVVSAPGEDERAGRITVIRGGRTGIAATGHSHFDQDHRAVPGTAGPGREFASTVALLQLSDDRRLDLALAIRGERSRSDRIMVIEGGTGAFAPDETSTSTVPEAPASVRFRRGTAIRLARTSGA
jgi:tRNA A-37 threonylcarbamoyl transferase component Bud32